MTNLKKLKILADDAMMKKIRYERAMDLLYWWWQELKDNYVGKKQ